MDPKIAESIRLRREPLTQYFDLPAEAVAEVDALFTRIEALGETCSDQADFEQKFPQSPLSAEYNQLFGRMSAYAKRPEGTPTEGEQRRTMMTDSAKSIAKQQIENEVKHVVINALPDKISNWLIYGVYNIPILGDLLSAKNTVFNMKRFFNKNKQ